MEIDIRQKILALSIAIAFILLVVELIRREKLKERYALMWLLTASCILFVTINHRIVLGVTNYFRILATANTLLFTAVMFLIFICLHFSIKISSFSDQIKTLAQELSLLKKEIRPK
ncbi:MAG: DUF2304 domain-containing protein [Candidatus Aureabacteria bacterium]|nr:DUF2304 domain-containing protein [Candidatus Auribacterota bacterium]